MLELHEEPLRRAGGVAALETTRARERLAALEAPTPVERRKLEYAQARGRRR